MPQILKPRDACVVAESFHLRTHLRDSVRHRHAACSTIRVHFRCSGMPQHQRQPLSVCLTRAWVELASTSSEQVEKVPNPAGLTEVDTTKTEAPVENAQAEYTTSTRDRSFVGSSVS